MEKKIEMHLHTKESSPCAKVSIKDALIAFKENGYDAVVVTDHFYHHIYESYSSWKEIVDKFLEMQTDEPQLLYIWGHSYELDYNESRWERFENLCKMLSGKEDVFYGTNKEVLV